MTAVSERSHDCSQCAGNLVSESIICTLEDDHPISLIFRPISSHCGGIDRTIKRTTLIAYTIALNVYNIQQKVRIECVYVQH